MVFSPLENNVFDQFHLVALSADTGRALTTRQTLADMLNGCAEAMVVNLDAAFARIWVLDEAENVLVLRASAGLYTHLDGPHGRVPVGQFKIGLIAQERKPHLTNAVVGDPRVSNQEWAAREGMVAFAGYPLIVDDRLVGVAALFARHPLPEATLQALGSVADQIGVGIERLRVDAERQMYVLLANNSDEFIAMCSLQGVSFYGNAAAMRLVGLADFEQFRRTPVADFFFPEDRDLILGQFFPRVLRDGRGEMEVRLRHFQTGAAVWVIYNVFTLTDASGRPTALATVSRDITERKALESERERLLAEAQARAAREALVNVINEAIRNAPGPQQVLEAAVQALAEALKADRCYYAAYDQEADQVTAGPEWYQAGLSPITGQYPMSRFAVNHDSVYKAGHTQVVPDTSGDPATVERGLCALIRVPLVSGAAMTALSVAMAHGPRDWTPEEVALVEVVSAQTQSALEAVRVRRREHNIAEQLQAALQPPLPEGAAGLKLAKHYEAALEEAGVGGDFFDCFPVEKGCTVLAVGDLSGKGLAAAAQVSTVRNMLRAFLYSTTTLAEAATNLNRVVALNGLLSGFATLWVGCYDGATGELAYVNLGQEPALLRRAATGAVEPLPPTGPVLGADENASYEECKVTLAAGDALAIFTDGTTECGPSRQEMLGIEGVTALLRLPFALEEAESAARLAEAVTQRLVAGVKAASRGGVAKDDVCILVAVAEGGASPGSRVERV